MYSNAIQIFRNTIKFQSIPSQMDNTHIHIGQNGFSLALKLFV